MTIAIKRHFSRSVNGTVLLASLLMIMSAHADKASSVLFERVNVSSGLNFKHEKAVFDKKVKPVMPWLTAGGAGVTIGDYNNDGLDDIYLVTSKLGSKNELYKNLGGFRFKPVGDQVGLANLNDDPSIGTSSYAMFFDFDGDGWKDLFLLRFGKTSLYKNIAGEKFTEVTDAAGVRLLTNSLSAVAFDYDNDNDLDLYIGGYFPEKDLRKLDDTLVLFDSWETSRNGGPNYMFENKGNGKFVDVTEAAGLQDTGWAMAIAHSDINNDGYQDIYIANDFGTDTIFRNNGNMTFTNISMKSIGVDTKKGMNAEIGDYNNDGHMDVYVTNMTEPYLHECNMLWRNNGNETFTDVSTETGSCDTDWGWGAKFFDANNDGLLDIYAANGFISAGKEDYMDVLMDFIFQDGIDLRDAKQWPDMGGYSMAGYERNYLFIQGNNGFQNIAKEAKVDSIRDSRGVAVADFDNDGRVDLLVSNVESEPDLYRNVSNTNNNWIQFDFDVGPDGFTNVIGTRVTLTNESGIQIREIMSGSGFDSQSSERMHFGLGVDQSVENISVRWPNGKVKTFKDLEANKRYMITANGDIKVDVDLIPLKNK